MAECEPSADELDQMHAEDDQWDWLHRGNKVGLPAVRNLRTGYGQDFSDSVIIVNNHLTKDAPKKLYLNLMIFVLQMKRIVHYTYLNT